MIFIIIIISSLSSSSSSSSYHQHYYHYLNHYNYHYHYGFHLFCIILILSKYNLTFFLYCCAMHIMTHTLIIISHVILFCSIFTSNTHLLNKSDQSIYQSIDQLSTIISIICSMIVIVT